MSNQQNVINDLGVLLKLPNKALAELVSKINLCIGSSIYEAIQAGETSTVVNIGVGLLSINLVDMQCKFVPSKELKATIKKCLTTKADPLELVLEKELADKLVNLCQEAL